VLEIAENNPNSSKSIHFWNNKAEEGVIPTRSGESMRNHFKLIQARGLDKIFQDAKDFNTRYCHAF